MARRRRKTSAPSFLPSLQKHHVSKHILRSAPGGIILRLHLELAVSWPPVLHVEPELPSRNIKLRSRTVYTTYTGPLLPPGVQATRAHSSNSCEGAYHLEICSQPQPVVYLVYSTDGNIRCTVVRERTLTVVGLGV